jgi:hypothetical protein
MTRDDKSRNLADSLDALASDEPGTSRRSERANQPAQSDRLPEAELVEPSKSDTNNPAGRAAGRTPHRVIAVRRIDRTMPT